MRNVLAQKSLNPYDIVDDSAAANSAVGTASIASIDGATLPLWRAGILCDILRHVFDCLYCVPVASIVCPGR